MATVIDNTPAWAATAHDFYTYWFMDLGKEYEASINSLLTRTWPSIQLALNSSGQADCVLGLGMTELLNELHLMMAMVMLNIAGIRLSTEQRALYNELVTTRLTAIGDGSIRVCDGDASQLIPASGRIINYGV